MVVPRSAVEIAADDEFYLYTVTVFKKHGAEFVHKAREKRWIPREFRGTGSGGSGSEGGKDAAGEEKRELESLQKEERKLWGEALRLGRNGYSEAVMTWMHAMALRVFVETVLRYGLPAEFVCGIVKVCFVSANAVALISLLTFVGNRHNPRLWHVYALCSITNTAIWVVMHSDVTQRGV